MRAPKTEIICNVMEPGTSTWLILIIAYLLLLLNWCQLTFWCMLQKRLACWPMKFVHANGWDSLYSLEWYLEQNGEKPETVYHLGTVNSLSFSNRNTHLSLILKQVQGWTLVGWQKCSCEQDSSLTFLVFKYRIRFVTFVLCSLWSWA